MKYVAGFKTNSAVRGAGDQIAVAVRLFLVDVDTQARSIEEIIVPEDGARALMAQLEAKLDKGSAEAALLAATAQIVDAAGESAP